MWDILILSTSDNTEVSFEPNNDDILSRFRIQAKEKENAILLCSVGLCIQSCTSAAHWLDIPTDVFFLLHKSMKSKAEYIRDV